MYSHVFFATKNPQPEFQLDGSRSQQLTCESVRSSSHHVSVHNTLVQSYHVASHQFQPLRGLVCQQCA